MDHVPAERRPPVVEAWIVPLLGRLPGVPVGELPPEVVVEEPDLGGYLMPLEEQEPFDGASETTLDTRHKFS